MSSRAMMADLTELQRFIDRLQQFNAELGESAGNISSNFATLGETWQDAQYARFAEGWQEALQTIQGYINSAPEYVSHLQRKAQQVSEYLD